MKPPPVVYHGPDTVDEAVRLLAEHGGQAKVLAGGQSLVPMLNMRLTAPVRLIDVNRLDELAYVRTDLEGVRVGALARHADVERATHAFEAVPLLRQAVRTVAHPTIRNRGTTVGSLVHADPCAEMPAVLALLDGEVLLRSERGGERVVKAADFFVGPMESALPGGRIGRRGLLPEAEGPAPEPTGARCPGATATTRCAASGTSVRRRRLRRRDVREGRSHRYGPGAVVT